jgi:hypothetical protein
VSLGLITTASGAALVAAGLLSVIVFPSVALGLVKKEQGPAVEAESGPDATP